MAISALQRGQKEEKEKQDSGRFQRRLSCKAPIFPCIKIPHQLYITKTSNDIQTHNNVENHFTFKTPIYKRTMINPLMYKTSKAPTCIQTHEKAKRNTT